MMHSANNGHHPHHHTHPGAPPPPHHLDARYMDYAAAAAANMAAAPHHVDPHALHYAAAAANLQPHHGTGAPGAQNPNHHIQGVNVVGNKRSAANSGLDTYGSSDDEGSMDVKPTVTSGSGRGQAKSGSGPDPVTGKKTKGRVKIKMEFIDNKLRRYTTFSKRKTGIMKKAYELSTLTGTQVMLLVASETGHVYTFATRKLQPMITSDAGKALIQTCLNSPDPPPTAPSADQRMSATGYEETELTYNVTDEEQQQKVRQMMYNSHYSAAAASASFGSTPGGPPPPHMAMNSPYASHPAPSPSPSHHGSYSGVSISPGPTSFASPLSQHSR